jgi:signal transduction histidine kinase
VIAPAGTGPRAAERVARTITVVTAAAAVLLGGVSAGAIITAAPHLNPAYTPGAVGLVFGGFAVLTAVTFVARLPVIRFAHGVYATLFLLAQLAWIPALLTTTTPVGVDPWVLELTTLGTVPAAIAWRAWVAWVYLILNAVVVAVVRFVSSGGVSWVEPLQYGLLTITLAAIFTALAMVAMRNAAIVDAATAELRETAARSAAATARAREQARLDALVHDEVMSTLFYASRADSRLDRPIRQQALGALAQLEALRHGRSPRTGEVTPAAFVSRLRSVVLDASLSFSFEQHGHRETPIPGDIAEAFAEATSEAARNSILHATGSRQRSVTVELSPAGVEVSIRDDGDGFDPRDVAPHRLGIAVSIRGRLEALPGGSSSVDSRPGEGTIVRLQWADR